MAIPVERLHYVFLQRTNHSNSQYLKQLSVAERDAYFNRAKTWLIPRLARHVERTGALDDFLQELMRRDEKLAIVQDTEAYLAVKFPEKAVVRQLRRVAKIEHNIGDCGLQTAKIRLKTGDKIDSTLRSAFRGPSWKFRRTTAVRSGDGLHVYHGDDFKVKEVRLDYITNIPDVAAPTLDAGGGYIDLNGNPVTKNVDLQTDSEFIFERILEIAAIMALGDMGYLNNAQAQLQEMASFPQLLPR